MSEQIKTLVEVAVSEQERPFLVNGVEDVIALQWHFESLELDAGEFPFLRLYYGGFAE